MIHEYPVKRATTGILTTTAGGGASAIFKGLNGALLAVEVILGTASGATVAITNAAGAAVGASLAFTSSSQQCPGNVISDGTDVGSVPAILDGTDTTVIITGGGNAKTLTVNLLFR